MRTALLAVVVGLSFVGCGDNGGGVFLQLSTTDQIDSSDLTIVLANADDATIALDVQPRLAPRDDTESPVDYYRQRASGGTIATTRVDGYKVKILPEDSVADDELFVPIVLVHNAAGEVVAIGTVEDENGELFKMPVRSDRPTIYTMNVHAFALTANVDAGTTGMVPTCSGGAAGPVASGVVWNPPGKKQQRLLFPKGTATDATMLPFDLDCDGVAADGVDDTDCDDLDDTTFPGATEYCDGVDSNCKPRDIGPVECMLSSPVTCSGIPTTMTNAGIGLCQENATSFHTVGTCVPLPTCNGPMGATAGRCVLASRYAQDSTTSVDTCSAGVSALTVCATTGCTASVIAVNGPFEVQLASSQNGNFGDMAVAMSGKVYVVVKDEAGTRTQLIDGSQGYAQLLIKSGAVSYAFTLDLRIAAPAATPDCQQAGNGNFAMSCTP
ncbi:hypothetical protein BH11MYX2_BH11MYX2_38230 [soil metagenome]